MLATNILWYHYQKLLKSFFYWMRDEWHYTPRLYSSIFHLRVEDSHESDMLLPAMDEASRSWLSLGCFRSFSSGGSRPSWIVRVEWVYGQPKVLLSDCSQNFHWFPFPPSTANLLSLLPSEENEFLLGCFCENKRWLSPIGLYSPWFTQRRGGLTPINSTFFYFLHKGINLLK